MRKYYLDSSNSIQSNAFIWNKYRAIEITQNHLNRKYEEISWIYESRGGSSAFHRSNIRRKKRESSQFPTLACFTRVKTLSPDRRRAHATFVTNACGLRVTRRARPFYACQWILESWRVGYRRWKILLQVVFDVFFLTS